MRYLRIVSCAGLLLATVQLGAEPLSAQSAPVAAASADTTQLRARGAWDGGRAAEQRSTRGAFAGGVASALVAPMWGLFIAWPIAGREVAPDAAGLRAMADTTRHYDAGFRDAYAKEVKSRRRSATTRGHLIGSVPWVILMIAMSRG